MKFDCGKGRRKYLAMFEWYLWFAWYPVEVAEDDCRWLEFVYTRLESTYEGIHYDYIDRKYKSRLEIEKL